MLTADMIHENNSGALCYAEADVLADLWNRAYPTMRKIATSYVLQMRVQIDGRAWEVDPSHPAAETLRKMVSSEARLRRKLRYAEDLRRQLGQLDRAAHKPCTRSPGTFTVTGAYMAVRSLLGITSLSTENLALVYKLAATLAELEEEVNRRRAARHREQDEGEA